MEEHPRASRTGARSKFREIIESMRYIEGSYEQLRDTYGHDDDLKEQLDLCFGQMMDAKQAFQEYMNRQTKSDRARTRRSSHRRRRRTHSHRQ